MEATTAVTKTRRTVPTRDQLLSVGCTPHQLARWVRLGELIRLRRGHYCLPGTASEVQRAVRVGGRLTCVSALHHRGVWVADDPFLHVAVAPSATRLRSPRNRRVRLTLENRDECLLHWGQERFADDGSEFCVGTAQALLVAVQCQPRAAALAALDSAAHLGLVGRADLLELRGALPARLRPLLDLVDPRCASGIESHLRLALLDAGIPFEVQVRIAGVGRVDFVVADRVVVETDGRAWHEGAEARSRDYDRDLAAVRSGYAVVRVNYRQVLFHLDGVMEGIRAALAHHRGR